MIEMKNFEENFEYPDAKVVQYKNEDIFIKQYLPSTEKYGLIYICLMSLNLNKQPLNPLVAEILFDTKIVEYYTNIIFDENMDMFKTYDILQMENLIDLVIENIPKEEYEEMQRLYELSIERTIVHNSSLNNILGRLVESLNMDTEEIDNFDPEKYKGIIEDIKKFSENNII
jgi:hypothetical protein